MVRLELNGNNNIGKFLNSLGLKSEKRDGGVRGRVGVKEV
jgi:hypothetical protein